MEKRVFDGLKAGNEVRFFLSFFLSFSAVRTTCHDLMMCDALVAREQVLKEIQAEMSLDAVEELMADTQEAIAHQQVRHMHHPPPTTTPSFSCIVAVVHTVAGNREHTGGQADRRGRGGHPR
jgi:hypothetical protein